MNEMTLKQAFNKTTTSKGILRYLMDYIFHSPFEFSEIPWLYIYPDADLDKNVERADMLDNLYFFNHSGEKITSPLVFNLYSQEQQEIPDSECLYIAGMFFQVYGKELKEMWNVINAQYNPLENYSLSEVVGEGVGGSSTTTYKGSQTNENYQTSTISKYPYDDNTPHPETEESGNSTDTLTFNQRSDETSSSNTRDMTRSVHGNIGVTTTQTLIRSSLRIWEKSFFYTYVFPYLDKILTLPIY